jgi:hypothetical protein
MPYDIPDFHNEADREKYENDTLSPFYSKGAAPTISACSRPDFKPTESQYQNYLNLVK